MSGGCLWLLGPLYEPFMKAHYILYVRDQESSTRFYSVVLERKPVLHVPGMTEFALSEGCILGLMPEQGIHRLLADAIPAPKAATAPAFPKAELYLHVDNPAAAHARALSAGARELSGLQLRSWGHLVTYCQDPDGYVLAFASAVEPGS